MFASLLIYYINYLYMKKMYKLLIIYNENETECETLIEFFDEIEQSDELISSEELANEDIRNELIKSNLMGEAWGLIL